MAYKCYNCPVDRLAERWVRLHLAFLPLGALVATWLLTLLAGAWRWDDRANLDLAGTLAPLGAFAYGSLVFVIEWSVRMIFWALEQRRKDREKTRDQIRAELMEEVLAEVRAQVQEEVQAQVQVEVRAEVSEEMERLIRELSLRGIAVPQDIIARQPEEQ